MNLRAEAMNRTQAAELQKHLLHAADAIGEASEVILNLDQRDRAKLAVPLGEISTTLHFELLKAVYDRHPELQPHPEEQPEISSDLQWEDVTLPDSLSEADLDSVIFS